VKVTALVVTYNRLELLKECLKALSTQDESLKHVLVVNNNSTDGTGEFLESIEDPKVIVKNLNENLGGAGGFSYGIKYFSENIDDDAIWIMDDDTIVQKECLKNMILVANEHPDFGFLASNVRTSDGDAAVMNVPTLDDKKWNNEPMSKSIGFHPAIISASFVSLLVRKDIIQEMGLPIKEFFIWGDDAEFTERISNRYTSYLVLNSIAIHKIKVNKGVDIVGEGKERIPRYFYSFRNRMFRARQYSGSKKAKKLIRIFIDFNKVVFKRSVQFRFRKILIMLKGILAGLFFNPKIEYPQKNK
jgi:GT2 family glycosyltransferase